MQIIRMTAHRIIEVLGVFENIHLGFFAIFMHVINIASLRLFS